MSPALLLLIAVTCVSAQAPYFPAPSWFHPACTLTTALQQDCGSLEIFLKREISNFAPGPQGLNYNLVSEANYQNSTYIVGNVTNPGSWYNFDFMVTLTPGDAMCQVSGISRSQMFGFYDDHMNFCNIELLIHSFNLPWLNVTNCWWQPSDNSTCVNA